MTSRIQQQVKQMGVCHKSHPIRPERRVCFASTRPERAETPSPGHRPGYLWM